MVDTAASATGHWRRAGARRHAGNPAREFVPLESRLVAYQDAPIPIGEGQTISQPYMTALMLKRWSCEDRTRARSGRRLRLRGSRAGRIGSACDSRWRSFPGWRNRPAKTCAAPRATATWRWWRATARRLSGGGAVRRHLRGGRRAEIPAALLAQLNDPGILVIPVVTGRSGAARADTSRRTCRLPRAHPVPVRAVARWRGLAVDALAYGEGRLKIEHSIIDGVRGIWKNC